MIYKNFQDIKLSALGMGCMRLPVDANKEIDMAKTAEMVEHAISHGVNYFDTAWGYHGGKSELAMGEILSRSPRESYYLASKFPDESYDIFAFLKKQVENGRIRHLGFSTHGTLETMQRFLDKYGEYMEFCQIQLNWLDWEFQNAKTKVKMLEERNIPVWVMEPLRGGSLCRLHPTYAEKLRTSVRPECTQAEVAFRYLQSIPSVTMILSGMSNFAQMSENIDIFAVEAPLDERECAALHALAEEMVRPKTLPCTACRYCTEYCPMELDIPRIIELYNEHNFSDGGFIAPMALRSLAGKTPSTCVGCRSCEAVCPQNIKISEMMADFASKIR